MITVRQLPPELERTLRSRARAARTSLNRAAISLMEEGAGLGRREAKVVHHDLDALSGAWSPEEASEIEGALLEQRTIDPDIWK